MPRATRALAAVAAVLVVAVTLSAPGAPPAAAGSRDRRPTAPRADEPGTVFAYLWEWDHLDVARECERFLGPKGFEAVQVSPPTDHNDLGNKWYDRYQPISYTLISRSGTEAQFAEMVDRCHAAGVRVYVDVVLNHAAYADGTSISGEEFLKYDTSIWAPWDFHDASNCPTPDKKIADYNDPVQVRNCELVDSKGVLSLPDLSQEDQWVRDQQRAYLTHLVELGVDGFRIDAAKHMWPGDLEIIFEGVPGDPYYWYEVIGSPSEPIKAADYVGLAGGDVTEFEYAREIEEIFRDGKPLASVFDPEGLIENPSYVDSSSGIAFIDNHDTQRAQIGGFDPPTFEDGDLYRLAQTLMLAAPYGYPKLMSSYEFTDPEAGPPAKSVYDSKTDMTASCGTGAYVCEHRWAAGMVGFRNATKSAFSTTKDWAHANGDVIGFARGTRGYVALNKTGSPVSRTWDTGLPAGRYCDVVHGSLKVTRTGCTGPMLVVNEQGQVTAEVGSVDAFAIHVDQRVGGLPIAIP